jgi:DNA-binding NarL/FixJ family response regulator
LTGQRILIAEDEGLIALELERMLETFGCEVVGPVSSVREVLEQAWTTLVFKGQRSFQDVA